MTWRHIHTTIVVAEKEEVLHILSVGLGPIIQHVKHMQCIILSSVAYLSPLYFSTLSHKGTIFGKKLLDIKHWFRYSLPLLSKTFLTVRKIQQDIIINVPRSSCKLATSLVIF